MPTRTNDSVRNPNTGKLEKTGTQSTASREKTSSGGRQLVETKTPSRNTDTISGRQEQAAIDKVNQQRIDSGQQPLVGTQPPAQPTRPKPLEPTVVRTMGSQLEPGQQGPLTQAQTTARQQELVTSPILNRPVTRGELEASQASAARIEAAKAQAREEDRAYNAQNYSKDIKNFQTEGRYNKGAVGYYDSPGEQQLGGIMVSAKGRQNIYRVGEKFVELGARVSARNTLGDKPVGWALQATGGVLQRTGNDPGKVFVQEVAAPSYAGAVLGVGTTIGTTKIADTAARVGINPVITTKVVQKAGDVVGLGVTAVYLKNTKAEDAQVLALATGGLGFKSGAAATKGGYIQAEPTPAKNEDVFYSFPGGPNRAARRGSPTANKPMSKQSMQRTGAGLPSNKNIKVGKDYFSQKNPVTNEQLTKYRVGDQTVVKYKGFGQERMVVTTPQPLVPTRTLQRIPGTRSYTDVTINVPQFKQIEYVRDITTNKFVAPNTNVNNKGFFSVPGTGTKEVQLYGSSRQIAAQKANIVYAPNKVANINAPKQAVLSNKNTYNIIGEQRNNGLTVPSMELTPNAQSGFSKYAYNDVTGGKGNEALYGRGKQGRVYIEIQNRLRAKAGAPSNIQTAPRAQDLSLVPSRKAPGVRNELVPRTYEPSTSISLRTTSQLEPVSNPYGKEMMPIAGSRFKEVGKYRAEPRSIGKTTPKVELGFKSGQRAGVSLLPAFKQTAAQLPAQRTQQVTASLFDYKTDRINPPPPSITYRTNTPPPPPPRIPPPIKPVIPPKPIPPNPPGEFFRTPKIPLPGGFTAGVPGGGAGGRGSGTSRSGSDKFSYAPTFTAAFFGIKASKKQRKAILEASDRGATYTGSEVIRPLL